VRKITESKVEYQIEGDTASGVLVHDSIRLQRDSDNVVKEFPFILVNQWTQNRFEKVDGVMGLTKSYVSTTGDNSGSTLLEALFQSDQIGRKIFSVHFDAKGGSTL